MSQIRDMDIDPKEMVEDLEQRGRLFKVPMRQEFNGKNILFKGTIGSNANEFLRSRNSSTHSNTNTKQRNHSITSLLQQSNLQGYPSAKLLLAAYNERTVSDTVLPINRSQKNTTTTSSHNPRSQLPSRASSTNSSKKNYTFDPESLAHLAERQESIVGIPQNEDPGEYRLELELQRRFNKSASISGPSGPRTRLKSSLNHSINASSNSSSFSEGDEDDDDDDEIDYVPFSKPIDTTEQISYDSVLPMSLDNSFPKTSSSLISASPKTAVMPNDESGKLAFAHDQPMRTTQRQMLFRDQLLSYEKEENELARKWDSLMTIDDRRMFETITNDLRKMARYHQRPVAEGLKRIRDKGFIRMGTDPVKDTKMKKFDLVHGQELVRSLWNELNETETKSTKT